jgi:uncharacterized membrane protein
MRKYKQMASNKFEIVIFTFILLLGLVLTLFIPPFQKADESTHYYRAVSVSRGEITCSMGEVRDAFEIPHKYPEFVVETGVNRIARNYNEKVNIQKILKADKTIDHGNSGTTSWKDFCNLSFIAHIIFIFPILIGNWFNSLLLGFFLSRFSGFIFFLLCIICAYKKIKRSRFRWVIIFYALTPMVLHQVTAIGYDYLSLALMPLIISFNIDFLRKKNILKKEIILYCLLLLVSILSKPGYYFLSLLYFLIPRKKISREFKNYLLFTILFFLILIVLSFVSQRAFTSITSSRFDLGILARFKDPINIIRLIENTTNQSLDFYFKSFVGVFGWLDYSLSSLFFFLYFSIFGFITYYISSEEIFKKYWRIIIITTIVLVSSISFIFIGFYIAHMHLDNMAILGVQGRYFLVFLPTLFLLFASLMNAIKGSKKLRILGICIFLLYIFFEIVYAIFRRYY